MITDVEGVRVGHVTHVTARTGCTVVLFPGGTVASAEVRGGAPATRELDLLAPERLVARIDAVVLAGGSAFGLAATDGVVRWCEEHGVGLPTAGGPVPIVPALALYDLVVGDGSVRPTADDGYTAAAAAAGPRGVGPIDLGAVGAGTGATVGKWRGADHVRPGGLGSATVRLGELVVSALVAVNAFGDIDLDGSATADIEARAAEAAAAMAAHAAEAPDPARVADPTAAAPFGNTTIGVIATNAALDKLGCLVVAQGGHDGLARSLVPAHTRVDGDALVAAATGQVDAPVDAVRLAAVAAVERAVRSVG